jgi:hypothetical protein
MSTPNKQKTEQKLKLGDNLSISISSAVDILKLEIDEIRASRTARYWFNKAKEYQEFREFDSARKELEKLSPGTEEYIKKLAEVTKLKETWEKKAVNELNKRNSCIQQKRRTQRIQEKLFETEGIVIAPNTT